MSPTKQCYGSEERYAENLVVTPISQMNFDPTKDIRWMWKVYLVCNGCRHISRSKDVNETIWKEVKV